ncbi:hypothetical protein [uncultured Desulfosarcina sp.]|uniref:hypothetical protein n=1 Tax=uncultured Desulfosarcina sp. TaxID=218289 RepID=UPI0029C72352|nr:hypothetical protein [uncultured Desulfosarcina sp.]
MRCYSWVVHFSFPFLVHYRIPGDIQALAAGVEQNGVLQDESKPARADVPQKSSAMVGFLWNQELASVMLPQSLVEKKRKTPGH